MPLNGVKGSNNGRQTTKGRGDLFGWHNCGLILGGVVVCYLGRSQEHF